MKSDFYHSVRIVVEIGKRSGSLRMRTNKKRANEKNMKNELYREVLLVLLFVQVSYAKSALQQDIIDKILRYENSYASVQIEYRYDDVAMDDDGTLSSRLIDGIPFDVSYSSSGPLERLDRRKADGRNPVSVVSNQERIISYEIADKSASIEVFRPNASGMSPISSLMSFQSYGGNRAESLDISKEDSKVTVEWDRPDTMKSKIHAVYEPCGDALRPVSLYETHKPTAQSPRGKSVIVTYEYDSSTGTPTKILYNVVGHNFTKVYDIARIDYNPEFDDSFFTLNVRMGTRVYDETVTPHRDFSYFMLNLGDLDDHSKMLLGITPINDTKFLGIALSAMIGVGVIVLVVHKVRMKKQLKGNRDGHR
jgi:hypothetical protein